MPGVVRTIIDFESHGFLDLTTPALPLPRFEAVFMTTKKNTFETIEPVGARVLVLKDEPKRETKGGIALPDASEIPTITGRIVSISRQVEHDQDMPLRQYDKIIFHPKNAIPVDFEPDNQLYVVPVEDVVAVFRKQSGPSKKTGELE
jgi:chaperonin GroES